MTEQKSLKPVQVTVFFPSSMDISEDRARWYLDHAIRSYWQRFAIETDPIRQMSKCSVSISPLTAASTSAAAMMADLITERDNLSSIVAGGIDEVAGAALDDAEETIKRLQAKIAALTAAAASAAEPVRVKPLQWIIAGHDAVAKSVAGPYEILKASGFWAIFVNGENTAISQHYTMDDAKEAAQADFEERIRSALV